MDNVVITIARSYGSGGKTIGKMLAEELGIGYYDREILRLASDASGINETLFNKADEKLQNTLLFRIAKKVYKGELIPPDSDDFVSNDNLFNYQAKVIKELAASESCIIVGRCADFVLKDYKNVINIFIHAPFESCTDTVMEMFGITRKEAEKKITDTDRHRSEYYRYYTGRDWENARHYDLCLNTEELGYEKCVEIIRNFINIKAE